MSKYWQTVKPALTEKRAANSLAGLPSSVGKARGKFRIRICIFLCLKQYFIELFQ